MAVNTFSDDVQITADDKKILFGAAQDASILYDGTDLIINPQEVGSGGLVLSGGYLRIASGNFVITSGTFTHSGGSVIFNDTNSASVDFQIQSAGTSNSFTSDGGTGHIGIGVAASVTATSAMLDVLQVSASGAVPVLKLNQLDISEEMIHFETTIGTGNAIEAVASKVLTTTHFVKVTIPGGLTRYFPVGTIA